MRFLQILTKRICRVINDIRDMMMKKKNGLNRYYIIYLIPAVVFGFLLSFGRLAADDLDELPIINSIGLLKWTVGQYNSWSSRVIINGIWGLNIVGGRIVFFIYSVIVALVFLVALKLMLAKRDEGLIVLLSVMFLFLFPKEMLYSAGWIATTTSYFGPQAFGLLAFVPIKKNIYGERMSVVEKTCCTLALIYASNAEQMCVALFAAYIVTVIYVSYNKRLNGYIIVQSVISLFSLIFMLTCPGNWLRKETEINRFMPEFRSLSFFDKIDIGISTTLKWMFYQANIIVLILCLVMCVLIWQKYSDLIYRGIALAPVIFISVFSVFKGVISVLFPSWGGMFLSSDVSLHFLADDGGLNSGFLRMAILVLLFLIILFEIVLLSNDIRSLLFSSILFLFGFGSHVMMGFSPTISASGVRTCSTFVVFIIALCIFVLYENMDYCSSKILHIIKVTSCYLIAIGAIELYCSVVTAYRA